MLWYIGVCVCDHLCVHVTNTCVLCIFADRQLDSIVQVWLCSVMPLLSSGAWPCLACKERQTTTSKTRAMQMRTRHVTNRKQTPKSPTSHGCHGAIMTKGKLPHNIQVVPNASIEAHAHLPSMCTAWLERRKKQPVCNHICGNHTIWHCRRGQFAPLS